MPGVLPQKTGTVFARGRGYAAPGSAPGLPGAVVGMHEYKVVPAPARGVKARGLKTTEDRFAQALTDTLNREAEAGWEYLRTETLPCTERKGLTGTRTTSQVVLIFRRDLSEAGGAMPDVAAAMHAPAAPAATPAPAAVPFRREPPAAPPPEGEARRSEPVFRPGALSRGAGERPYPPLRSTEAGATDGNDDDRR